MATNFYGKRIPTQIQLDTIANLAKIGNLVEVQFHLDMFKEFHIGKKEAGFSFLFNHNDRNWENMETYFNWLKNLSIYDNYGNQYTFEQFYEEVMFCVGKTQPIQSFVLENHYFANSPYFS